MHQLEPETAGEFERGMMGHARNTRRRAETGQNQSGQPLGTDAAKPILPLSKVQTSNQTVNTMFFRGLGMKIVKLWHISEAKIAGLICQEKILRICHGRRAEQPANQI
jgi:hypothetical protein